MYIHLWGAGTDLAISAMAIGGHCLGHFENTAATSLICSPLKVIHKKTLNVRLRNVTFIPGAVIKETRRQNLETKLIRD